jgi:C1A family cysteine protease
MMANGQLDFADIQRDIERNNAQWIAGDNPIWQLSEEQQLKRLGAAEPAHFRFPGPIHYHPGTRLPNAFDYRKIERKNYVTKIRDQGNCGSCVAFGSLGAIEATVSRHRKHANPKLDLSEAHLFFCFGPADGATCGTAWWPAKALPHCVNPGTVDEACFPYTDHDQPCKLCKDSKRRLTKIKSFSNLPSQSSIKHWLVRKGAVTVALDVYKDFLAYRSGIYRHVTGSRPGGHCVALIGYNDVDQCWLCKNSWDTSWGEKGFFRIEYGQCRIDTWGVFGIEYR